MGLFLDRFGVELDYANPLAPDWATRAGESGSAGLAKPYSKKYPGYGKLLGSESGYDVARGWRLLGSSTLDPAIASRVQFENVGRTDEGDFTYAVFCTMESGIDFEHIISKGGAGTASATLGVGVRAGAFRAAYYWNGLAQSKGFNADLVADTPYFISISYDAVSNALELRYFNLDTGEVKAYSDTEATWPPVVSPILTLGAHRRTATGFYRSMTGVIDSAFVWDRLITAEQLDYIATNKNLFWIQSQVFNPSDGIAPPEPTSIAVLRRRIEGY